MLDNVIDINYYAVKAAETSNMLHRPIGLGIMGFHDALYMLETPYASEEAVEFADRSMEMVSYYAIKNGSEKDYDFLTEKQREVLELAVLRGYYEDGSEVTLKQLADELGIARSTIGEHLKRAESEVVKKAVSDFN